MTEIWVYKWGGLWFIAAVEVSKHSICRIIDYNYENDGPSNALLFLRVTFKLIPTLKNLLVQVKYYKLIGSIFTEENTLWIEGFEDLFGFMFNSSKVIFKSPLWATMSKRNIGELYRKLLSNANGSHDMKNYTNFESIFVQVYRLLVFLEKSQKWYKTVYIE